MASNITLPAGVRQNLSLQKTASLMATTQNRLATGKRVNSALDNPTNFFTSTALPARAGDLSNLLDAMSNGIKTLEAADNGISAITRTVESMQSTVRQARQDESQSVTPGSIGGITNRSTSVNNTMSFDLGGGVWVSIDTYTQTVNATVTTLTGSGGTMNTDKSALTFSVDDGNGADAITFAASDDTIAENIAAINAALTTAGNTVRAFDVGGNIELRNTTGGDITVCGTAATSLGFGARTLVSTNGSAAVPCTAKNVEELVAAINASSALTGKVKASKDASGDLQLDNLTTSAIAITGFDGTDVTGDAADVSNLTAGTVGTVSNVHQALQNQFNDLKTQLDKLATDCELQRHQSSGRRPSQAELQRDRLELDRDLRQEIGRHGFRRRLL